MTALPAEAALRARAVRFLLLDVDGILTDGRLYFLSGAPGTEMQEVKGFDTKDGLGITLARRAGIEVGLLSGRRSAAVTRRAEELGMVEVLEGAAPKLPVYDDLLARRKLTDPQICYMGDDIVDIPILRRAGLAATTADAHPEAKQAAHVVTVLPAGRGAVREIVDGILRAQGRWEQIMAPYRGSTPGGE
jgi:3-deoxy-D-manno-octulosonate 8-phosphate phosphatase (KDO 8-P phosphatase)